MFADSVCHAYSEQDPSRHWHPLRNTESNRNGVYNSVEYPYSYPNGIAIEYRLRNWYCYTNGYSKHHSERNQHLLGDGHALRNAVSHILIDDHWDAVEHRINDGHGLEDVVAVSDALQYGDAASDRYTICDVYRDEHVVADEHVIGYALKYGDEHEH